MPATAAPVETVSADDLQRARTLAEERYTAARRRYTHLYVDARSQDRPDPSLARDIKEASDRAVELAAALRAVEDGDPAAVRRELAAGPVTDEEKALTTDRFTIAALHRAAKESVGA